MQLGNIKYGTKAYSCLSDVDILGSFDFSTAIVSLDSLTQRDAEDVSRLLGSRITPPLTVDQYLIAAKVFPLAVHEYAHFLDATSTLWGLRHLSLMDRAYASSDRLGSQETSYSNAKAFADHCRRIRLPKYYTVVEPAIDDSRPWKAQMSIGYIFDHNGKPTQHPVLFSRFLNADDQLLARSPISTVSLLEASAMAQELLLEYALLQFTEQDFRLVESRSLNDKTRDRLFDKRITEYSVCAHVVSNKQGCLEVLQTFRLCAALVRTVLNFPDKAFERAAKKCPVGRLLGVSEDSKFAIRMRNGLHARDLGILFYLLCCALPDGCYATRETIADGIRTALEVMGLSPDAYTTMRDTQAKELADQLSKSRFGSIRLLSQAGYDNLHKVGALSDIDFFELNLPPAFLGDAETVQFFNASSNSLRELDLETCFSELNGGESWVERFTEACI